MSASAPIEEITNSLRRTTLDSYLFLPDNPFSNIPSFQANYTIYIPPTNSSGDIYHILTYLMLSKYENKKLLAIQLSYNGSATSESEEGKMNTFSQIQRCIQFVKHFGFEDQFLPPTDFGKSACRPNPRLSKMVNHLKEHDDKTKNTCYIEQKFLTTLISNYFVEYGRDHTVQILNELYAKWSVEENINQTIRQSVEQRIQSMPKKKPLIILQYRYSSKANKDQNIDEPEILIRLEEYLKSKDYATWYLFVDSRSKKPSAISKIKNKTNCFPYEIDNVDYGKLFHLEFLLQLLKIEKLKGIIGNTSGCLDLAAFIGHNVLNLHHFHGRFNYQSYRIFLQSSFLVVEYFDEDVIKNVLRDKKRCWINFTEKTMNENMPLTAKWIGRTQNIPIFPLKLVQSIQRVKVNTQSFIDLHQIIAWQDDELEKTSIPIFKELTKKLCDRIKSFYIIKLKSQNFLIQ